MVINQIYTKSFLRNFTYILEYQDVEGEDCCLCIDPFDSSVTEEFLKQSDSKLKAIINTHEHHDHVGGNETLVDLYQCEVWVHENGKGKIPRATHFFKGGEIIDLNKDYSIRVLNTPGHTFAHLCFLLMKEGKPHAVFTGDTLFNAGVGNCHNGGDPETLFHTVSEQLQTLPGDVLVYPGHDYWENNLKFTLDREPNNGEAKELLDQMEFNDEEFLVSSLDLEKKVNSFLRLDSPEIRKNLKGENFIDKQVFIKLRELRNQW